MSSKDDKGFQQAYPGYQWQFPRDHGNHPEYQTEWWYYTGHLKTAKGEPYGFQLTFFRSALANRVDNPSSFNPRDLYFAHFAVSDLKNKRFWYAERMDRPALGLAGSKDKHLEVWVGDWKAVREPPGERLTAREEPWGLDLMITSMMAPVLNGRNGYSQKGSQAGNASMYYSFPLLSVEGTLRAGSEKQSVKGRAWMDHEFFSSEKDSDAAGWDWFGLQFNDGTELMLYRMRLKDGSANPASSGTWVDSKGKAIHLKASDIQAQALETWKSPKTNAVYPIRWKISVPKLKLGFEAKADFPDQELDTKQSTRVVYWEGSVSLKGKKEGRPVGGEGYMELTGYEASQK